MSIQHASYKRLVEMDHLREDFIHRLRGLGIRFSKSCHLGDVSTYGDYDHAADEPMWVVILKTALAISFAPNFAVAISPVLERNWCPGVSFFFFDLNF